MVQIHRQLARVFATILRAKPVPSVWFTTQNFFIKIALGSKRRKRLIREVRIGSAAGMSAVYANRAVSADSRFGTLVYSTKFESSLDYDWIIDSMLELWQEQFLHIRDCPYKPAVSLYDMYFEQILNDGLISREDKEKTGLICESLRLPLTYMHGDLAPSNVVRSGSKMLLVDWEWGSDSGTVLYDWWYFTGYLRWIQNHGQSVPDFSRLEDFIKNSFQELAIDPERFEDFGKSVLSLKTEVIFPK